MVSLGKIGAEAFEVFEDVKSAIAMYMFILEESIQTANMGVWILHEAKKTDDAKELAQWIRDNLANPLYEFANSPAGMIAFPLNECYKAFAQATLKNIEAWLKI